MRRAALLLSLTLVFCGATPQEKFNQFLKNRDYISAFSVLQQVKPPQREVLKNKFLKALKQASKNMPLKKILLLKKNISDPQVRSLLEGELRSRFDEALRKKNFPEAGKLLSALGSDQESKKSLLASLLSVYSPKEKPPSSFSQKPSPMLKAFPKENLLLKYTSKNYASAWYWVEGTAARLTGKTATQDEMAKISFAMLYARSLDVEMSWYGADKGLLSQVAGVNYFVFKVGGGNGLFIWDADTSSASIMFLKGRKLLLLEIFKADPSKAKKAFIEIFRRIKFERL